LSDRGFFSLYAQTIKNVSPTAIPEAETINNFSVGGVIFED
jgi:hypothetical protein